MYADGFRLRAGAVVARVARQSFYLPTMGTQESITTAGCSRAENPLPDTVMRGDRNGEVPAWVAPARDGSWAFGMPSLMKPVPSRPSSLTMPRPPTRPRPERLRGRRLSEALLAAPPRTQVGRSHKSTDAPDTPSKLADRRSSNDGTSAFGATSVTHVSGSFVACVSGRTSIQPNRFLLIACRRRSGLAGCSLHR